MFRPAVDSVAGRARGGRTRAISIAIIVAVDLLLIASGAAAAMAHPRPIGYRSDVELPAAGVALAKTVYAGHDGGVQCDTAAAFMEAGPIDPVTYCFVVTNSGSSWLSNVEIVDELAGGSPQLISADTSPLAPGGTATYYIEATPPPDAADGYVDDTFINTATVTATPVDDTGSALDGASAVSASAEAVVFPSEGEEQPAPDVALMASVYAGADGGAGCPAAKSAVVPGDGPVTYCFTVTNTGNTHLDTIGLAEPLVSGSPTIVRADSMPLAPGGSAYYFIESEAPATTPQGFVTKSMVTANSVDGTGADLVGLDDVTSTDGAQVQWTPAPVPAAVEDDANEGLTEPAASDPTAASGPDVETTQAEANAVSDGSNGAAAEAPAVLAFTGWESWLLVALGIGLMAGGWLLMHREAATQGALLDRLRFAMAPVPNRTAQRAPYSTNRSTSTTSPAIKSTSSGPSTDSGVA